jgi:hypothetical protein
MGMSAELNVQTVCRPNTESLVSTEREIGVQSKYKRENEELR